MHKYLSASSSAFDMTMASSSNQNLSISLSSEEEDAAPSLATNCPRGTCCSGWAAKGIPCWMG